VQHEKEFPKGADIKPPEDQNPLGGLFIFDPKTINQR
jgi:hypothetical protein